MRVEAVGGLVDRYRRHPAAWVWRSPRAARVRAGAGRGQAVPRCPFRLWRHRQSNLLVQSQGAALLSVRDHRGCRDARWLTRDPPRCPPGSSVKKLRPGAATIAADVEEQRVQRSHRGNHPARLHPATRCGTEPFQSQAALLARQHPLGAHGSTDRVLGHFPPSTTACGGPQARGRCAMSGRTRARH